MGPALATGVATGEGGLHEDANPADPPRVARPWELAGAVDEQPELAAARAALGGLRRPIVACRRVPSLASCGKCDHFGHFCHDVNH